MRLAFLLLTASALAAAQGSVSPQQAEQLHQKILLIVHHSTASPGVERRTIATEPEVNSYLRYKVTQLPQGVTEPTVTLVGQSRISGRAIVDLDAVRQKQSSGGWLDPMAYLTGKLPVTASGTLVTKEGSGRFVLDTAEVGGVPMPKTLLHQIVAYYTRSPEHPSGINFEEPFDLPAGIRRIDIEAGRAVVMQ
ncbi:MAG: hypothetical protein LC791_05195 [Acidobacteria bacterium]|nr:hypothetical protein [Acidobacteriota bacterium]